MKKISPWFLLLAVLVTLVNSSTMDRTRPGFWREALVFPAYVVVLVALDHVILPRMRVPGLQKARVSAGVSAVLTILLVWIVRPSVTVGGILVVVALRQVFAAFTSGRSEN